MEPSRMTAQAYAIADQALFRRLESTAKPLGPSHKAFRLTDAEHKQVASIDAAAEGQRTAVGWLRARGYIDVREGADGRQRIVVVRRPANPMKGRS